MTFQEEEFFRPGRQQGAGQNWLSLGRDVGGVGERWEEVLVVPEEGVLWETEGKTRTGVWKGQGQEGMGVEWAGSSVPG